MLVADGQRALPFVVFRAVAEVVCALESMPDHLANLASQRDVVIDKDLMPKQYQAPADHNRIFDRQRAVQVDEAI